MNHKKQLGYGRDCGISRLGAKTSYDYCLMTVADQIQHTKNSWAMYAKRWKR